MPVPKRQHSKTRGAKRRTHWKLRAQSLSRCPQCGQPKLPHRVCQSCGTYAGRAVVAGRD